MEEKNLKMSFVKSGSGSENSRANLPITWVRKCGITPEDREYNCRLEENDINFIILSKESLKDYEIIIKKKK